MGFASARGERAAMGWAAVRLVAPLAILSLIAGCAVSQEPAAQPGEESVGPRGPAGPEPGSDPAAIAVADRMLEAMGGWDAWERSRFLRFGFVVEEDGQRPPQSPQHLWDRWSGQYRVDGRRRIGDQGVDGAVLFNVDTRQGDVWVRRGDDWEAVAEADEAAWLEWAYGRFINDTYWLLMPYKLRDSGVILEMAPAETIDGVEYQVVHLRFENVGLTPGDRYWAFIHPQTWLLERWAYILEGEGPPRTEWAWTEWGPYGHLMLSRTKVLQDAQRQMRIVFEPLAVLESVDAAVFETPALPLPTP